jgi:catechol-2,3-dioxygenase
VESMIARLLQDFEQGKMTRRQLIQSLAMAATAATAMKAVPAAAQGAPTARAVSINHISYQVADYTKVRDFYSSLLGLKVSNDDGKQCELTVGNTGTYLIARNRPTGTKVDHIAYTLENWDNDKSVRTKLEAELKRRKLDIRETEGGLHVKDPAGFEVQLGGKDQ